MKWNKAPALVVLTGLLLAAGAGPAAANAAPECAPAPIATDANVRRRWPDLREQIQQAFEERDDVDVCARIDIAITGVAVIVKVTLPDGRTAARSVLRREDVLPALEALLLLPESSAAPGAATTTAAETAAKPVRVAQPDRIAATVTILPQEVPAPVTDAGAHLRIELGLGVEARAGDGQMGAGVGVASFLELAHWLLGFQARIDSYRPIAGDAPMSGGSGSTALELDALIGRRFELGTTTALDLAAGPALAMHGDVRVSVPVGSTTAAMAASRDEQGLPRLIVSSRLTLRARAAVRTFVQLDAELGRYRSSTQPLPDQAELPAWTAGLAIGATVGTR